MAGSAGFDSLEHGAAREGIALAVEAHVRDADGLAVVGKHGRFPDDHDAVFPGDPFDDVGGQQAVRNRIGKGRAAAMFLRNLVLP